MKQTVGSLLPIPLELSQKQNVTMPKLKKRHWQPHGHVKICRVHLKDSQESVKEVQRPISFLHGLQNYTIPLVWAKPCRSVNGTTTTDRLTPVKITTDSTAALLEVLPATRTETQESARDTLQKITPYTIISTYFK